MTKCNPVKVVANVKPYVAIKALFTMMMPTEVTMLNVHAAISTAAFLSALLDGVIFLSRGRYFSTEEVLFLRFYPLYAKSRFLQFHITQGRSSVLSLEKSK